MTGGNRSIQATYHALGSAPVVMSMRRTCSERLERKAVELTPQHGVMISQVGRDIGDSAAALGRWQREMASGKSEVLPGSGLLRDQELMALKRELARVTTA